MAKTKRHYYSKNEEKFLTNNIKGKRIYKLTNMFNDEFETNLKKSQIRSKVKRMGLKSGVDTTFKKGDETWNKGMKGLDVGSSTQFKKGHTPQNIKPVGSERVNRNGYVEIKVKKPNIWKLKHRVLYKKHKGEIPKNGAIIFADKDRSNLDLDNLILVKRKELLIMNRKGLIYEDSDSTKVGVNIAKVKSKVNDLKRKDDDEK